MNNSQRSRLSELSLVEVLLLVGMVVIVFFLAWPWLTQARDQQRRMQCLNNLHQLGIAAHNYHDQRSSLPPFYEKYHTDIATPSNRFSYTYDSGVFYHLLPFIDSSGGHLWIQDDKPGVYNSHHRA